MGKISFEERNVAQNTGGFPKLKLEKHETSRIVCLEDPWSEYVHNLRAPKLLNGRPVMKQMKTKDGEEYETYEYDFIGNPICLGDPGILQEKGSDPAHCPACARAEESDSVYGPKRRFAMHVIKYSVRQGSATVADPYSVQTVVWAFTDMVFGQLVSFATEYTGGLPNHDLILGPCEDKTFQKFKIMASEKAEWLLADDRKALTIATFKGNRAPDLADCCGMKKEVNWYEESLKKIKSRWAIVNGDVIVASLGVPDLGAALEAQSLAAGLDELLRAPATPVAVEANREASEVNLDDLLNAPTVTPAVATPAPDTDLAKMTPVAEVISAAPKPGSSGEVLDFDAIMGELSN